MYQRREMKEELTERMTLGKCQEIVNLVPLVAEGMRREDSRSKWMCINGWLARDRIVMNVQ